MPENEVDRQSNTFNKICIISWVYHKNVFLEKGWKYKSISIWSNLMYFLFPILKWFGVWFDQDDP